MDKLFTFTRLVVYSDHYQHKSNTNMKLYYLYTDSYMVDWYVGKYGIYPSTLIDALEPIEREHMAEMQRLKDKHFLESAFKPNKKMIREFVAIETAELERLKKERSKFLKDTPDWTYYNFLVDSKLRDIDWYKFFDKKSVSSSNVLDKEKLITVPISRFIDFKNGFSNCIFHSEKSPSMKFYPTTNTIHCFGCGKTANAIQAMQQVKGCDFKTALQELSKLL